MSKVTLFWFRRDLRIADNAGLYHALTQHKNVLPIFIFDKEILSHLTLKDARVEFIHQVLTNLKVELQAWGSDLIVRHGSVAEIFEKMTQKLSIEAVYCNHDYEPAARVRDSQIEKSLSAQGIAFKTFKDQCLFEKDEILSGSGTPYTVYTPYKNKVLATLSDFYLKSYPSEDLTENFIKIKKPEAILSLSSMGFQKSGIVFPPQLFFGDGIVDREERGERLDVEGDGLDRSFQAHRIAARNERNGLVHVANGRRGEHRLIVLDEHDHVVAGNVGSGDHRDARPVERRIALDSAESAASDLAPNGGSVECAGHHEIVDVRRDASHLCDPVDPRDVLSNEARSHVRESTRSEHRRAPERDTLWQ